MRLGTMLAAGMLSAAISTACSNSQTPNPAATPQGAANSSGSTGTTTPAPGATPTTPSAAPPTTPSPATSTAALSASYTTYCVACHGADGSTVAPGATLPVLKGNKTYGKTAWQTAVRSGISGTAMGAQTSANYSDAAMAADYTVLTGLAFQ